MPRTVVLEHVQVGRDGSLVLRALKQVTLGKQIHSSEPHLHRGEPGEQVDDVLASLDACLETNGWPALGEEDAEFVRTIYAAGEAE